MPFYLPLEKRIRKLENQAGVGRCENPDHGSVFFIDPNNKAPEEAKLNRCVSVNAAATAKEFDEDWRNVESARKTLGKLEKFEQAKADKPIVDEEK